MKTEKKGDQLRLCGDFRYLNSVAVNDAYPIPRIDESLSKMGDANFFLHFLISDWSFGRYRLENKTATKQALLVSWDCFNGRGCH